MSENKMSEKYKVFVDDNYHYMDEGERIPFSSYNSLQEALDKCKEITISSLEYLFEKDITPDQLRAQWSMFGEDPFIFGGDGPVPFSARKLITTELCEVIIERKNKGTQD